MRLAVLFAVVAATTLVIACVSPGTTASQETVTLERTVHFPTADGTPVVLADGTYAIADTGAGQLRVAPVGGGDPILLPTASATHDEKLTEPRFISGQVGNDSHRIALELPWGVALEAKGSYSGTMPRATLPALVRPPASTGTYTPPEYGPPTRITISATAFTSSQKVFLYAGTNGRHLMNPSVRPRAQVEPKYVAVCYPLALPHEAVIEEILVCSEDHDQYADMQCTVWACSPQNKNQRALIAGAVLHHSGLTTVGFLSPDNNMTPNADFRERIWSGFLPRIDNENLAYTIEVLLPQRYYDPAWFASNPAEMRPVAKPDSSHWGYHGTLDTFGGNSRSLETHFVDVQITYKAPLSKGFTDLREDVQKTAGLLDKVEEIAKWAKIMADRCETLIEALQAKVAQLHPETSQ